MADKKVAVFGIYGTVAQAERAADTLVTQGFFANSDIIYPAFFLKPEIKNAGSKLTARNELRLWTDDYSNLFRILK